MLPRAASRLVERTYAERAIASPLGDLRAIATARGIAYLGTPGERPARVAAWRERRLAGATREATNTHLDALELELARYFDGDLWKFRVPLDLDGTPFQRAVWEQVCATPYGKTTTYGAIAARLGRSGAERAVGAANGANAAAILVPCHRVIAANGALIRYAGGVRTKARLLKHEAMAAHQARLIGANESSHSDRRCCPRDSGDKMEG